MKKLNVKYTWKINNPHRKYSGSTLFGVHYCILKHKPVHPKEGDALIDVEKWEIEIFLFEEWRPLDFNLLGGPPL